MPYSPSSFQFSMLTFWRAGAIAVAGVITLLSLLPSQSLPADTGWDKLNHLLAYAVLTALLDCGWRRLPVVVVFLVPVVYGALIEMLQATMASRYGSLLDLLANTLGVLLWLGLHYAVWPRLRPMLR